MQATSNTGLGLIELMVGLALGLGVMLAASVVYQAQRQSWLLMQGLQALHHNANAALDHLQTSAQSANAENWGEGNTRSDVVAWSHFSALDGYDCQGNHVGKQTVIRDSYQVNSKKELTCKDTQSAGSTYQAIAEGVEDFQLLYAERLQGQTSGAPSQWQWKRADQIAPTAQVMAIEICLRMVSTTLSHVPAVEMHGCKGESVINDGKLRRVFRRVVAMRSP